MTTTERAAASDVSFPLCSFLPFQTASETCGLGFSMQISDNLSVSLRLTAPLKGEPWVCVSRKPFFLDFPAHFR